MALVRLIWQIRYWWLDRKRIKIRELRWSNYFASGGHW